MKLPISDFIAQDSREALAWYTGACEELTKCWAQICGSLETATAAAAPAIRKSMATAFYESDLYRRLTARYSVETRERTIGGVPCEVFTPRTGISRANRARALINLHGGAFIYGSRTNSHLESIPIAALGQIKVISVDYRMAPEHCYPAATDDLCSVYEALLDTYDAGRIGLFGGSAGALLTSQALTRFHKRKLPMPGAVGLLAGGAFYWKAGDSGCWSDALLSTPLPGLAEHQYFPGISPDDPEAFPGQSPESLARFPPALIATSTRDFCLSSAVRTHAGLILHGVDAELHVFEGLDHVFHWNPELPESRCLYGALIRFFERHLK